MTLQPAHIARAVLRVDRAAVGQFSFERDACLIAGFSDEHPLACLIDFTRVSLV